MRSQIYLTISLAYSTPKTDAATFTSIISITDTLLDPEIDRVGRSSRSIHARVEPSREDRSKSSRSIESVANHESRVSRQNATKSTFYNQKKNCRIAELNDMNDWTENTLKKFNPA